MSAAALGIIAGNGEFPRLLLETVRHHGVGRLVVAAFEGETDPALRPLADDWEWVRIGQLNKLIHVFTDRNVTQVVAAGGITPANLFKNIRLDFRAIAAAAKLKVRNAETIFGAIADELSKDGITVLDPRPFLGDNLPGAGPITRRKPDREQQEDIAFGWRIAKEVSRLDIGQTVVVKKGTILAVEGFEGTDECIKRGGALAGEQGGAVVVKVSKPNQDFRFDIPCVGLRTVESCRTGRISVLAMEAGSSLLLGRARVAQAATDAGVILVGVNQP